MKATSNSPIMRRLNYVSAATDMLKEDLEQGRRSHQEIQTAVSNIRRSLDEVEAALRDEDPEWLRAGG